MKMANTKAFDMEEAKKIGEMIGIDWENSPFGVSEFRSGLMVELEHGSHDPQTNVTNDDPVMTGRIALAHLKEFPDYYKRLENMEEEAKKHHRQVSGAAPGKIWSGRRDEPKKKEEGYSPPRNIWSRR